VYADGSPILNEEEGENGAWNPAVSGDGRIVVFGTHLGLVFVHDRRTGLSRPINLPSGDCCWDFHPHAVSGDGRFVVSSVSGAVIYVHDLLTGTTEALATGGATSISHDGRLVTFSASSDVFVRVR
jgi:hypothetical protein